MTRYRQAGMPPPAPTLGAQTELICATVTKRLAAVTLHLGGSGAPPKARRLSRGDPSTDTSVLPERLRAGREVAGLASALAEGVPIRTLADAWLVRKV